MATVPKQPAAPMSTVDITGAKTTTSPVAPPAGAKPSGSPDKQ